MVIVEFDKFVTDYNNQYDTDYRLIRLDTFSLCDVIYDIYNSDDYEIDYDREVIELYDVKEVPNGKEAKSI